MDHPRAKNEEKIAIQSNIVLCEEKLFKTMTPEQVELFCEYEENMNEHQSISESEAFVFGVRFAVNFLLEAGDGGQ